VFLGIEIGGTKLQLGVGTGDGAKLIELLRVDVDPAHGADGIVENIRRLGRVLIPRHDIQRIGIGFGGPIDPANGRVITSHQVAGWDGFPLKDWCEEELQRPTILGNDCDCAAVAEAIHGAGKGHRTVFYITVGTGVGGGLVIDGQLQGLGRPAVAEIGHLRPGLNADQPHLSVESLASGPGIESTVRAMLAAEEIHPLSPLKNSSLEIRDDDKLDLISRSSGNVDEISAKHIADAAMDGNELALAAIQQATQTLGWAIAQVISLIAPEVVVVGGGVSLAGDELFYEPLREQVSRYVFPPLAESYHIAAPQFGETVVVQGAVTRACNNA